MFLVKHSTNVTEMTKKSNKHRIDVTRQWYKGISTSAPHNGLAANLNETDISENYKKREQSTWRSIKTTKPIGVVTFHPGDMYAVLPKCLMYH